MFIIYPLSHESIIFSFDYNFPGDGPKILLLSLHSYGYWLAAAAAELVGIYVPADYTSLARLGS